MPLPRGFGEAATGKPDFWIAGTTPKRPATTPRGHVAFHAVNCDAVDTFYASALSGQAPDSGALGLRPHHHPHYYAAFVLDPDDNNKEAVCHAPA